ncbi:MAG: hypothetical protein DRJ18_03000, partial [Candidatus Methanomethylicota archaeon]
EIMMEGGFSETLPLFRKNPPNPPNPPFIHGQISKSIPHHILTLKKIKRGEIDIPEEALQRVYTYIERNLPLQRDLIKFIELNELPKEALTVLIMKGRVIERRLPSGEVRLLPSYVLGGWRCG